jgi:formylmethanofuran dehydrogenase subunit B
MKFVRELNNYAKFTLGAFVGHCKVAGFNLVASYMYGFPFGLVFTRGTRVKSRSVYNRGVLRGKRLMPSLVCVMTLYALSLQIGLLPR